MTDRVTTDDRRGRVRRHRRFGLALLLLGAFASDLSAAEPTRARYVILMVADGAGFNAWRAASMYEGTLGEEIYDGDDWVRLAASAHALRRGPDVPVASDHAEVQVPTLAYDPARAWDPVPVPRDSSEYPFYFEGYRWLRTTAPDSASTMSALTTGRKTYNGAINVDGGGDDVADTLARLAADGGRRVGVVTDVLFAHATPAAGGGAHAANRRDYCPIAIDLLASTDLDVIAGCGNPDFDHNGNPLAGESVREYRYVGGPEPWAALTGEAELAAGASVCPDADGGPIELSSDQAAAINAWQLEQSRSKIERLVDGPTPSRLLIVPQVGQASFFNGVAVDEDDPDSVELGGTLQQQRGSAADPRYTPPGHDPMLTGVPSLATLTRVALNALDDDRAGFFLQVEGGAVDWAMHMNQLGRTIEELRGFKDAMRAVVEWVDEREAWDESLIVVTADHDHMLWGPRSHVIPFQGLEDRGAGRLPGYRWLSDGHSNALVPVFARGVGAERLRGHADRQDPYHGPYVDQTEIHRVLRAVLTD